ncbi:MAG: hypothetical protein KME43_03550 [Myxacorys chilensis ATA2-1-KO14]|nr:hypothetical protein [Myxacorys chilensis ATA2-1-KO14]
MAADNIGNSEACELVDLDDRNSGARLFRLSVQIQWGSFLMDAAIA